MFDRLPRSMSWKRSMLAVAVGLGAAFALTADIATAQIGPTPMPKVKSPPITIPGTCVWRGTAPFCAGRCLRGERRVAVSKTGSGRRCVSGWKVRCCRP